MKTFEDGQVMPTFCTQCGTKLKFSKEPLVYDPDTGQALGEQEIRICPSKKCSNKVKYQKVIKGTGKHIVL